jgi:Putative MetA-pathway of phenol degradation
MPMKKLLLATLLLTISMVAIADEAQFGFTTGLDYSTGKYGLTEATRIKYVPFTGKVEYGRWLAKITVPWLEISGPGAVTGGDSKIILSNVARPRSTESGLGDIVSSLTYTAYQSSEQKFTLDIGAKVKFATASTQKGLGTGSNDYAVQLDAYKTLKEWDKLTLLGTLGYKTYGKPELSSYGLDDTWFGTLGAAYKINARNSAGLLIDLRQAAWTQNSEIREYTVYYSHRFNPNYNLQTYMTTGDTRSSVDFSGGIMLGISF